MCICSGCAKSREMLEASNLAFFLHSAQIRPTPVDHILGGITPGAHILIWPLCYRYIHIRRQISVDANRLQVVGDSMCQFRRVLDVPCLECFQSSRSISKDIHYSLNKSTLLVSRNQE